MSVNKCQDRPKHDDTHRYLSELVNVGRESTMRGSGSWKNRIAEEKLSLLSEKQR